MKRVLIAVAMGLLTVSAFAADLPMRAPPPTPVYIPAFSWTGIYIGVNGGYSSGTTTTVGSSGGLSTNGFVAGGTFGGNFQAGMFVFGAEGDFDWDNIKGTPSPAVCPGCLETSNWLATATWASRRCVGSASHLRHWWRCFSKLEVFYVLQQRCHEPNWLDRWRRHRICHIAKLVSEGRIPVHRLQQ